MYLSTITRPAVAGGARSLRRRPRRHRWAAVGANVVALGTVSLITDVSAEMVTAVLPVYLVLGLHLGPFAYGAVDGLYTGATALLRLVGGYLADRTRRLKAVAAAGYALSALAKLAFLPAGASTVAIGAVITLDRTGKGLRTAPRDAIISLSAPPSLLGRAFGLHRTMDSVGAFAGPLVALGVLAAAGHQSYDSVFVTSFCLATLGVLLLVLFVRDPAAALNTAPAAVPPAPAGHIRPRDLLGLLRDAPVRRLVAAAALLGLATIGDGFIYLLLQRRTELATGWFPLLAVGTNLAYLVLAAPVGVLADRIGRLPVVLGGYGALLGVYLLLAGPDLGLPLVIAALALHGLFYAATDGVLMALAGPVLPARLRTTGMALIQTGQALAYLVSSLLFGLAWQVWGAQPAIRLAALLVVATIVASAMLLRRRPRAEVGEAI